MSEGKRITFADIKRQMELASEDIETWPTWMRRAAGLDGEGPDYNTLRAENARLVLANQELERRIEKILLSRERLERELRGYPPVDNDGIPMVRDHDQEPWRKRDPLQPERGQRG